MLKLPGEEKKWWIESRTIQFNIVFFLFGCFCPGLSDVVRGIIITPTLGNILLRIKTQKKIDRGDYGN